MAAELRAIGREQCGPICGYLTNRSGSITAGDASQALVAANHKRCYFLFQNHSAADMWLQPYIEGDPAIDEAVAGEPSIKIAAGQTFQPGFVDKGAWQVLCDTTDAEYTCYEGENP